MGIESSINSKNKNKAHQKNLDKPEIFAERNKVAVKLLDRVFEYFFKKYFYSIRVKNKENYYLRNPGYANLFYGFHGCWWDGPLAALLCRKLYDSNFYIMIKDLYRLPALSLVGGFSIEKDSKYGILRAVNHSVKLLENPENSLWLFPQGNVCISDSRPIKFQSGIAHICNKLKGVNLIPVAYRYTFLRSEKPEIFVEIGKPMVIENSVNDKKVFLQNLQQEFERFLDAQKLEISQGKLDEYEYLVHDDFDLFKKIENLVKPFFRLKIN